MTALDDFLAQLQKLDPSANVASIKNMPGFLQTPLLQQLAKQLPSGAIDTNRFSTTYLPPGTSLKQALSNPQSMSYAAADRTSQLHQVLDKMNSLQQSAAAKSPAAVASSAPDASPGMTPGDSDYYNNILKQLGKVPTGITSADLKQAGLLAGENYDPQISELKRQEGQAKTDTQRQMQDLLDSLNLGTRSTQEYGKNYDKDIAEIYQVLGKQLTGLKGTEQGEYKQTAKDVASGYNEAETTQDAAAKQLQSSLAQNAAQLGQQSAVGTPMEQLAAQLGVSQSRTAASKAAATSNVQQRAAEAGSAATMGISSAGRESAQKRADLRTDISTTLGQLQNTYLTGKTKLSQGLQDQLKELGGKITDLLGAKGKDIQSTAYQLSQARSAADRQRLMDQLDAKLKVANQKLSEQSQSFSESVTKAASGAGNSANEGAAWDAMRSQPGYGPRSESALTQAINTARQSGQDNLTGAMAFLQAAIDQEKKQADTNGKTHNPLDISYLTHMLQLFYSNMGSSGTTTTTTTSKKGTTTSVKKKS